MIFIKNHTKKVELLSSILFSNIFSNKKEKDDYLDDAYNIVIEIDGKDDKNIVAELICNYYLATAINDYFSDFESISAVIASEYLLKVSKL